MRTILKILVMLGLVLGAGILGWFIHGAMTTDRPAPLRTVDVGPILDRIHTLSSLTTLRVEVADAITMELRGKTGGISAVLVVHGEATLAVDLSQAKFQALDESDRRAILVLPPPRVQSVKLDHQKTKLIGLSTNGLWLIVPGGDEADATLSDLTYRRGEELVATAAADPELAELAREQAERVIQSFVQPLHWTIEIQWGG
ncbi:MAG: DUF4230 domain-containing protein [Tepidisphaeraceae bacterium]|jgi:hypothetical protein